MGRRFFTAEFKHEAVKLVLERGMTVGQAAKDLGLHRARHLSTRARQRSCALCARPPAAEHFMVGRLAATPG